MVINHTDCGLMHTSEQDLRTRIQNLTGTAAVAPAFFYAFQNIEENVRHHYRNFVPIPGFPQPSPSAASSTTSPPVIFGKSRVADSLRIRREQGNSQPAWHAAAHRSPPARFLPPPPPSRQLFALTFAVSWIGALFVAAPHLLGGQPLPKLTGILMFPAMLLGPSVVSIALTRLWMAQGVC